MQKLTKINTSLRPKSIEKSSKRREDPSTDETSAQYLLYDRKKYEDIYDKSLIYFLNPPIDDPT